MRYVGRDRHITAETACAGAFFAPAHAVVAALALASVGSEGDSYDNVMAEALNSLFKADQPMKGSGPNRPQATKAAIAT